MSTQDEDNDEPLLVPVSALEHYAYCPRQCALIHTERYFDENVLTARGTRLHEHVDEAGHEAVATVRVERALPIWSERLGLIGRADVVEFLADGTPFPVEYKLGTRRQHLHDDIQLCAQALCLEEMLGRAVPQGAIFHHGSRRRREVTISPTLRTATEQIIAEVLALLQSRRLPAPVADSRCRQCSLIDGCLPFAKPDVTLNGWDLDSDEAGETLDRNS